MYIGESQESPGMYSLVLQPCNGQTLSKLFVECLVNGYTTSAEKAHTNQDKNSQNIQ